MLYLIYIKIKIIMNDKDKKDDFDSILKSEGIIIENNDTKEEEDIDEIKTKELEIEIFKAVGVEIKKEEEEESQLLTDDVKKELSKDGVEVLPRESYD